MDKHQTVLGTLFLVLGIVGILAILVVLFILGLGATILAGVAQHESGIPPIIPFLPAFLGLFISLIILLVTISNFIAAYGLLAHKPWAALGALVVGVLNLLNFPLGTAVGIYAVWFYLKVSRPAGAPRI